ncbi:DeoR/GlpR family DNA-binding transcription regulator [Aquirufa sp. ROCK-SH2]
MLKVERLNYILKQINLHNRVLSTDLSEQLNVSEDTIRRDLAELADANKILKVHGGAVSKTLYGDDKSVDIFAYPAKLQIAEKAISLIKDGMFILVGGGTTLTTIIRNLPQDIRLTFITVSLSAASELLNYPNCEIIFIGGRISDTTRFCFGGDTINRLSEIRADLCILGTNAIDVEFGLTDSDYESVQVKKAMIRAADAIAVVTISEKLGSKQRIRVCNIADITYLITELNPHDPLLSEFAKNTKVM